MAQSGDHMGGDAVIGTDAVMETLLNAPVGFGVWDRELRFRKLNARLAEINGLSVEDHLGRPLAEVLPRLAAAVGPMLRDVMLTDEPLENVEIRGETQAVPGLLRTWLASYYPVHGPDGRTVGVGAVVI